MERSLDGDRDAFGQIVARLALRHRPQPRQGLPPPRRPQTADRLAASRDGPRPPLAQALALQHQALKLGEQYQKLGKADYAQQIWQRGAGLFPDDPALSKLSAPH